MDPLRNGKDKSHNMLMKNIFQKLKNTEIGVKQNIHADF